MADDRETALGILMGSLTDDPDNKEVLLEISAMLYEDGRLKDALVYADRAKEIDPLDSAPYVRRIMIFSQMGRYRAVLNESAEAISNVRGADPMIWNYSGDAQMYLGDYSNALISYDTAMKLGIDNRDIYHSRGMCQEASGMNDAAIMSYSLAYQRNPDDTDSMIREAAVYLKEEKDQPAGKALDRAIGVDPQCSVAIIARATIYASRGNEAGVKRMFDHCVSHDVDEDTKQTVAELMGKAKDKEVVAMPVIPLVMPEAPAEPEEEPAAEETPVTEEEPTEEAPEETTDEPEGEEADEEGSEEPASGDAETELEEEESEGESEERSEESEGEELEDGFMVDGDSETGFVIMTSDDDEIEEEKPVEPVAEESEPEPVVQEEETVAEGPETEAEKESDVEIAVEEPEPAVEETEEEIPSEEPEIIVDDTEATAEEPEPVVEESEPELAAEEPPMLSVEEYALKVLELARDQDEMPDEEEIVKMAGIPAVMADQVFAYLMDIQEYGKINPNGGEFEAMEKMSYEAIVKTGADDIEDDPVISMTSAYYQSGAKDIDTAKRLVAYVYEAMTGEIDYEAVFDRLSEIADDVEFNEKPNTVFGIMSKYHIGVYSARAVKNMVFNKDGSVIGHI